MLLSLDWLKDLVDIPKNLDPKELGIKLTTHTVEIDGVETQAEKFNNVVIGKVLEVAKHPDADRLNLAKVDVGKGEVLDIVCGAPNLEAGLMVPVALVGAELPGGFVIEQREVRGQISNGMICAEDELGLGSDHAGIMILDKGSKVGKPLIEHLKLSDVIFEVDNKSITNRPDLWGHLGMAREIATFLNTKTTKRFDQIFKEKIKESKNLEKLNIKIENKKLCPRYMAVKLTGVEVKDSPKQITDRLMAAGLNPINNVVDAANYVMLELGQPMHTFDAENISEIIVRSSKKDEQVETLDGQQRKLDEGTLVIADKKEILAVAGVIGGKTSGVFNETKSIILESANFEPINIRKSSQRLGLRTEASMRFEKSLDPNMAPIAINRFFTLLKESCPKLRAVSSVFDESNFSLNQGPIKVDIDWINKRIGESISEKEILKILKKLGFEVLVDEGQLAITVPTWRATKDVSIAEDIVEEVARMYGYNNIKTKSPGVAMNPPLENRERSLERKLKNLLSFGVKMNEVYNYSFVDEDKLKKMNLSTDKYIELANPIVASQKLLRQRLIVNLLDNVKANQARYDTLSLFEFGNVFLDIEGDLNKDTSSSAYLPYQEKRFALLEASSNSDQTFLVVKGKLEYLMDEFGLELEFKTSEIVPDFINSSKHAKIIIDSEEIGLIGSIKKDVLNALGIKKEVSYVEISFVKLFKLISLLVAKKYKKSAKYPSLTRDLSLVLDESILYKDVRDLIIGFDELIVGVELFDLYKGKELGDSKKNMAFHIDYMSEHKTLESEEVEKLEQRLVDELEKVFGAKLRSI